MQNEKQKQYEKQQKIALQKKKQHKKPEYYQPELPFHEDWSKEPAEKPLRDSEVNKLFWNKLVQLGWRMNEVQHLNLKTIQFMFTCQDCGKGLHTQQAHTITPTRAKAMVDTKWLDRVVQKHKTDPAKGCKPEYDEDGETIAKAIPEEEAK
jgi:hypothetical protein